MRRFRILIVSATLSLSLLVPASIRAQRLPPPIPSHVSYAVQRDSARSAIPKTYWLEGGVIGGVALGVLAVSFFSGMSDSSPPVSGSAVAFVIGASVGFPVGALIGGQVHKHG